MTPFRSLCAASGAFLCLTLAANCAPAESATPPSVESETPPASAQDPTPAQDTPPIPDDTEIQTTASGLKYSALSRGEGTERPGPTDKVRVHYTGWLPDGTLFDSSRQRGTPAEFPLNGVIAGWTEGLQLMAEGDRFKFTIPYDLAYGENGRPPTIPAKATLIFDVELLEITAKAPRFVPFDAERAVTTESGLKYVVENEGQGDPIGPDDSIELQYAYWTVEGELKDSSALGRPLSSQVSTLPLPFLQEAAQLMQPGGTLRLEVPKALWGAQQAQGPETSIWMVHLSQVFKVPDFSMPTAEELTTTASGLQYVVVTEGTGKSPAVTDTVTVHYAGWLTDGTPFDSSYSRGKTASFPLNGVIAGWTEGLQLMKEGGTHKFVIPGNLAYGERGSPPKIGPDATLVFQVELVKIGR